MRSFSDFDEFKKRMVRGAWTYTKTENGEVLVTCKRPKPELVADARAYAKRYMDPTEMEMMKALVQMTYPQAIERAQTMPSVFRSVATSPQKIPWRYAYAHMTRPLKKHDGTLNTKPTTELVTKLHTIRSTSRRSRRKGRDHDNGPRTLAHAGADLQRLRYGSQRIRHAFATQSQRIRNAVAAHCTSIRRSV